MRAIGYFLGATLGAAVLFLIISFIFFRPRKVTNNEVEVFIKNSDLLLIKNVPLITSFDIPTPDVRLGRETISKLTYFSNRNMSYYRADTYTYFSKELNKYIRTYYIDEIGRNMTSTILDFGDKDKDRTIWPDMYFYYNKTQNADPSYGTIDKPLPILHFRSANPALRSMRQNNGDSDPVYLKERYTENVKLYLEYFIEKEDFKKLFPEN
ncbi:hypothetical protein CGC56_07715 [Capnocytophaga canimorsus]|uniref:DUF8188 domain-containing protein n=2 Tax=Capnocytophaga canimorsus TaxID=28188 RepID=A0A250G6U2_9FLAO|nr:hypothetical protein [Capnocytophaga canimorsus]ATA92048.1 hypothetical protein CGC56_07715 [Capnocytophaga canimorsus]